MLAFQLLEMFCPSAETCLRAHPPAFYAGLKREDSTRCRVSSCISLSITLHSTCGPHGAEPALRQGALRLSSAFLFAVTWGVCPYPTAFCSEAHRAATAASTSQLGILRPGEAWPRSRSWRAEGPTGRSCVQVADLLDEPRNEGVISVCLRHSLLLFVHKAHLHFS